MPAPSARAFFARLANRPASRRPASFATGSDAVGGGAGHAEDVRPQPQMAGRPARAASEELSLDTIFRAGDADAERSRGGYSFDQFYSGGGGQGDDGAPTVRTTTGVDRETGRQAAGGMGGGGGSDIEQFTAWLEGLKKK
jgi:hypothetical protein